MEKFWSIVGKIGTVIAILAGVFAIYKNTKSVKPDIRFNAEKNIISFPTSYLYPKDYNSDNIENYRKYLLDLVSGNLCLTKFHIVNKEDIAINDLKIISENSKGSYCIVNEGYKDITFQNEILLTTLYPESSLEVWVWTRDDSQGTQFRLLDSRGSYKIGEVPFLTQIFEDLENNFFLNFAALVLLIITILIFIKTLRFENQVKHANMILELDKRIKREKERKI